ncbi:MAG: anti-sigma F factor [Ruminococcaceae bacterium]|nr:anti-sigma F factor [Oscillospiraceae bacterium]
MSRKKSIFKGKVINRLQFKLPALSINEAMARTMVGVFVSQLDPEVTELADIKCAVSEAVTNSIVHGYRYVSSGAGIVTVTVSIMEGRAVRVEIKDQGCGISNVQEARQPLFTTDAAGERSGMGFTVMESFTDAMKVVSKPGQGTTVTLCKVLKDRPEVAGGYRRHGQS